MSFYSFYFVLYKPHATNLLKRIFIYPFRSGKSTMHFVKNKYKVKLNNIVSVQYSYLSMITNDNLVKMNYEYCF